MPEHQQIQQSKKTNTIFQKQPTPISQTPISNPYIIIQRARINPKSLTHADIMQLQRTIGNRAVGRLLSSIGSSSTAQKATVQRQEIPEEEEPLQGKMIGTIQRQEIPQEEEPLQGKMAGAVQRQEIPEEESLQTKKENNTGMPDNLKAGVENLSGIDMSDVRVHYNSDNPAEVGALAYTQGTDIHVAPEQERHLPHEAWHVAQQKQGRVQPTLKAKGVEINDDAGLENEADVMGSKALSAVFVNMDTGYEFSTISTNDNLNRPALQMKPVIQMLIRNNGKVGDIVVDKKNTYQGKHIIYKIIEVLGDKKNPSYKLSIISKYRVSGLPGNIPYETEVKTGQHDYTIKKGRDKKEATEVLRLVHLKERATVASSYTKNPGEIWRLARSEETEPLIEESAALARHKVREVRKLGVTSAGGMVAGKVVNYGGQIIGQSMGPVAAATDAINALHTGSQAARLAGLESADPETREAISHLAMERTKKSAVQVGKTTASAATGATVGAAIGTAIPVPFLGTLVGGLVGYIVGSAAGKATEISAGKVLQDPRADYMAVLKLHEAVRAGDEQALLAFKLLGVDEETAREDDGWDALAKKIGASPETR